jgi:hypothetical protein
VGTPPGLGGGGSKLDTMQAARPARRPRCDRAAGPRVDGLMRGRTPWPLMGVRDGTSEPSEA